MTRRRRSSARSRLRSRTRSPASKFLHLSSPGVDRPLRTPAHFERAVGRQVALRTSQDIEGRKRFKGEIVETSPAGIRVSTDGDEYEIPYEAIVRGNLIEESVR